MVGILNEREREIEQFNYWKKAGICLWIAIVTYFHQKKIKLKRV